MKRIMIFTGIMFAMTVLAAGFAQCGTVTATFTVSVGKNDGTTKTYNGATSLTGSSLYLGSGFVTGWRFENVTIPKGMTVSSAVLELFSSSSYYSRSISVAYSGEASDNSGVFTAAGYELINRVKTSARVTDTPASWSPLAWNKSADLAPVLQEIIDRPGWQSGNALSLFVENAGGYACRSVYTVEKGASYGARLTVTYSDPVAPPPPSVARCEFDTNRDGVPDIVLYDTDGDGFCELPAGTTAYLGTLIIDKPIEVVWNPNDPGKTGALLKGDSLILTEGGAVISELVLHGGNPSNPGLRSLGLEIWTRNGIQVEFGGEILFGGVGNGTFAGDVTFTADRTGANIFMQGDADRQGTWIYGRNVRMTSGGSIYVTGNLFVEGNGDVTLSTREGDINVGRGSIVWAGTGSVYLSTVSGDVNLSRDAEMAGTQVNMYYVVGNVNDDGTTKFIGSVVWPKP